MHTIFIFVHIFACLFVEIYNPAYLETHYVDQSGFKITETCLCLHFVFPFGTEGFQISMTSTVSHNLTPTFNIQPNSSDRSFRA